MTATCENTGCFPPEAPRLAFLRKSSIVIERGSITTLREPLPDRENHPGFSLAGSFRSHAPVDVGGHAVG